MEIWKLVVGKRKAIIYNRSFTNQNWVLHINKALMSMTKMFDENSK